MSGMRKPCVTLLSALSGLCGSASVCFAQTAPRIDEIHWPGIGSYCTFMGDEHSFVFDDPETWRLVFFTSLSEERLDTMARAFMRIDGRLHELALVDAETEGTSEQHRYRTHSALAPTRSTWRRSVAQRATGPRPIPERSASRRTA